jgi:hypothetical protein
MADESQTTTVSTEDTKKQVMRQLSGTSFLTLEHIGYFALVVLMPVLLMLGATTALQLWQNGSNSGSDTIIPMLFSGAPIMRAIDTSAAVTFTAAFLVLAPFMYILRRRTAAEYVKRPGYTNRVGYKLPVYTALGILATLATGAFISMLSVFLDSLLNIGVNSANIGAMYTEQFLPALLAFVVFGMACWYTMWFAKGRDVSKAFVNVVMLLAAVMAVALFVTTLTINHDTKKATPLQTDPYILPDDTPSRY